MAGTTIDIDEMIEPHALATEIVDRWNKWNQSRQTKIEEWKELRNYLYATDTRTTSNSKSGRNSVTTFMQRILEPPLTLSYRGRTAQPHLS
jgi:hypothetical protein